MNNRLLILVLFCCFSICGMAQKNQRFNENELHVKWEFIQNSYQSQEKTLSVFTLVNKSKRSFPSAGWTIYFNSSREIDYTNTEAGVIFTHVNGDIYKMVPAPSFKIIRPKDSVGISYLSNGLLLNTTATPSGLYIVWDNDTVQGYSLFNYTAAPFSNTSLGMVSPEKIYKQNSVLKDIPASALPKIFPTPVSYKETGGLYLLNTETYIETDPYFKREAEYLSNELGLLLGKRPSLNLNNTGSKKIVLLNEPMVKEAYQLSVTEKQITIKASSGAGMFYGIQSLHSLMPVSSLNGIQNVILVPTVEVSDAPRFGYRSLMLDVARNFKSKEAIFKVLDLMAFYKMNVFHFHFSDDEGWRIEIPSLPELTDVGAKRGHTLDSKKMLPASYGAGPVVGKTLGTGYYTRKDFIEILTYAHERHIQVIPEIESPGHSRAAIKSMDARYDKFMLLGNKEAATQYLLRDLHDQSVYSSAQQWTDNVMCVAMPSVYTFIETVVDELSSMYKEAAVPLFTIHMGGDEVPVGSWKKSPLCNQLIATDTTVKDTDDLWYYYFSRVNKMLQKKGIFLSAWEEAGMRKTMLDGKKTMIVNPRFANDGMQLHVWNNVPGWGAEDLPYRLANAGYKVVLSPVSNNYLDLAYYNHPEEPGYYWGGFQDIDKPFYFMPFDYYKTSKEDPNGNAIDPAVFIGKDRLSDFGKSNIVGIQGLLWNENVRSLEMLDYLLLPKLLAVAERAWAPDPVWANTSDKTSFLSQYNDAWSVFVNVMGKRELPRLDYLFGGFNYRLPAVGAVIENGVVLVNVQFPGLIIRYTTDGKEPTVNSKQYQNAIIQKGSINIKVFDNRGRGSRTTTIQNN